MVTQEKTSSVNWLSVEKMLLQDYYDSAQISFINTRRYYYLKILQLHKSGSIGLSLLYTLLHRNYLLNDIPFTFKPHLRALEVSSQTWCRIDLSKLLNN